MPGTELLMRRKKRLILFLLLDRNPDWSHRMTAPTREFYTPSSLHTTSSTMAQRLLLLLAGLLLAPTAQAFYLPGVNPQSFKVNDE